MSEPMLTIHNPHPAACGIPPAFSTEPADLYIGYVEDRHGEQWIFTFNRARLAEERMDEAARMAARAVHEARESGVRGRLIEQSGGGGGPARDV